MKKENTMKVAILVRVSTIQQTTENQLLDLYEVCERNDWTVTELFKFRIGGFSSKFNDLCCLFFRGFVPFLNVIFSTMSVSNSFSPFEVHISNMTVYNIAFLLVYIFTK